MKKYIFLLLASATLGLTSCSPFNVRSDYAETANFNEYKTYKLRIDDLKLNDIDKDRVLNEVSRQLQTKGLSAVEFVLQANLDWWNKLSPEAKDAHMRASKEVSAFISRSVADSSP